MHRSAITIEELQRPPHTVIDRVFDREPEPPVPEEDAQVDILAENEPHRIVYLDVLILSFPLVHHIVVACQRHDMTELRKMFEEISPVGVEPGHMPATACRQQLRLADTERQRRVADAHLRLLLFQILPCFQKGICSMLQFFFHRFCSDKVA